MNVFVTGASGWIGTAVVTELVARGHTVTGLARSDSAATTIAGLGASVVWGSLDDLAVLHEAAAGADAVIHLAFKHDLLYAGDMVGASEADRQAIEAFGEALAGTDRALLIASGVFGLAEGRPGRESDGLDEASVGEPPFGGPRSRTDNAHFTIALADQGVRSCVVRLSPTCHGPGDNGFMRLLADMAKEKGVSGYVGDGSQRWPAVHRLDAARLFCQGLENAPAGSVLHGVAEQGVAIRDIAEAFGRNLGVPTTSVAVEDAFDHFGVLGFLLPMDAETSSEITRDLVSWDPVECTLLEDIDAGWYSN